MYRLCIIFLFGLLVNNADAQEYNSATKAYMSLSKYVVLDSAYMKCSYKLDYLLDSTNRESIAEDIQTLLIGQNITKYYSQNELEYGLFVKSYLDNNKHVEGYPSKKNAGWTYEVYQNYPPNKMTVTDIASILQENYIYEEELPIFNWVIFNETQSILSYDCQKATTSFRGRDYIAWFAPAIPISNGPWKFGGLPGLILKLCDTKEEFVFECNGLEQLNEKEYINFYKIDFVEIKRDELNKMYHSYHNNFINYLNSLGIEVMVMDPETNDSITNPQDFTIPYNPIELE